LFYALVAFLKKWAYIKKSYSYHKQGVNIIKSSQPKAIKPNMRDGKLRSGVNWKEVLKGKRCKRDKCVSNDTMHHIMSRSPKHRKLRHTYMVSMLK
jgi:hypothetical protein